VPHADVFGGIPQLRAAGREEAAQQTVAAELFPFRSASAANGLEHALVGRNGRSSQREVVAHPVQLAPDPARIDLNIADEECRILRT
jgi:hypothetical protein